MYKVGLFADRLREWMKGMPQADLADKLDIRQQSVAAWLTGRSKPNYRRCADIDRALGLPPGTALAALQANDDAEADAAQESLNEARKALRQAAWEDVLRARDHLQEFDLAAMEQRPPESHATRKVAQAEVDLAEARFVAAGGELEPDPDGPVPVLTVERAETNLAIAVLASKVQALEEWRAGVEGHRDEWGLIAQTGPAAKGWEGPEQATGGTSPGSSFDPDQDEQPREQPCT